MASQTHSWIEGGMIDLDGGLFIDKNQGHIDPNQGTIEVLEIICHGGTNSLVQTVSLQTNNTQTISSRRRIEETIGGKITKHKI